MKTTILAIIMVLVASLANAAEITKLGFRAWSSASNITCMVFGQSDRLKHDGDGKTRIQGFSPNDTYSRTYSLGTKGFGHYSGAGYAGNINLTAAKFDCRVTGTSTFMPVKVFFNDIETYWLTQDNGTYIFGQ
jgi:hypothetical protein